MITQTYTIGGMHCAACSAAVERVTRKLPGVAESNVNLPMNRMVITYDPLQCTPEDIVKKVERAGFTAELQEEKPRPKPPERSAAVGERTALILSCCFAGLLLTVSMGPMLLPTFPLPALFSPHSHPVNYALLQLLLCIPVLVLGRRFFIGGFGSLFRGNPNMDTLVAMSAAASFLYSLVTTFLLTDNPHAVHNLYYESAAVVVALVSVGKYLETVNKEKTTSAIRGLMELTPETAILADENGFWEVPVDRVKPGDRVLVKPGSRVPLDGVVEEGTGSVDEAMLTGEGLPVPKQPGSRVIGGSISVEGVLTVKVTHVGQDTALAKIIRFVEDAQLKKAPISRTADRVAGIFVPVVMGIGLASAVIWLLTGAEFGFALKIFTCVLVIACPCAMGLATPTAIVVGTGLGAGQGILIRSGEALEITRNVDVVIFDKTGTLTRGTPEVTGAVGGQEMLTVAASLEVLSDHPLARAVTAYCKAQNILPLPVTDSRAVPGRGVEGLQEGRQLLVGSAPLLEERGISLTPFREGLEDCNRRGCTPVLVAAEGVMLGYLTLADSLKEDAARTVEALHAMSLRTVLLTGDSRSAAEAVGKACGITHIEAEVLPTDKAEVVARWQRTGARVMMVGDGINDAPALTQADVGCAIGSGSDIAIEAADIVLMKPALSDVCKTVRLSRLTLRTIRQNLFWAFCYNVICIPIAAGVLYPAFGLLLSPMLGGLTMSLSSLFVVTNALRLKTRRL